MRVGVLVRDETAWLTLRSLSELFGVGVPAIAKHLKNIFESGELEQSSVLSILETTAADGKVYSTQWYHLDAVIAVGYRVNSYEATRFRVWATGVLREFIVKGRRWWFLIVARQKCCEFALCDAAPRVDPGRDGGVNGVAQWVDLTTHLAISVARR